MKKFEIPYNFDKELIEHLTMLNIKKLIHSIYLPPFKEDYISAKHYYTSSKRQHNVYNTLPDTRIEYESHIQLINNNFPNTLMLLLQQNDKLMDDKLLNYYYNLGIHKFCVGSLEQAKIIRNKFPSSEIIGSITMKIMPKDLDNPNYNIFNGFVLWFPYNRNLPQIKLLPKQYKYILLVNCDCSIYCNGTVHWLASSLDEENNSYLYCPHYKIKRTFSNTIRINPEDLSIFEPYIAYFKLQGREFKTFDIITDICKYTNYPSNYQNNESLYYNDETDILFNHFN